jgi:hypothetical protein
VEINKEEMDKGEISIYIMMLLSPLDRMGKFLEVAMLALNLNKDNGLNHLLAHRDLQEANHPIPLDNLVILLVKEIHKEVKALDKILDSWQIQILTLTMKALEKLM